MRPTPCRTVSATTTTSQSWRSGSRRTPQAVASCSRPWIGADASFRPRRSRWARASMRRSPGRSRSAWRASGRRPPHRELGNPNTMPAMSGTVEIWAARAWNVFNEGRPFTVVYPLLVLVAAEVAGLGPGGALWTAVVVAGGAAVVLSRFSFALRGRALLWVAALMAAPLLEPWRAPA